MFVQVTAPPGATISHTHEALRQIREYLLNDEKQAVKSVFTISGFNCSGRGQNSGLAFVSLKDWAERSGDKNKVQTLATRVMHHFSAYRDAQIIAVAPPAVTELGNATGFDFELQDRGGLGHAKLIEARNQFLGLASKSKKLVGVRPNGLSDEPQYKIDID